VAVGKRCGKLSSAQQFINKRLVDAAKKYQTIVRLKGGDPMLFGRADEEITTLKEAGITVQVVPGITAALAGAASLQQSLTLRGISRSVAFVTLAQGAENLGAGQPITNPNADTLVYYMGRKDASQIAQQLIENTTNHTAATPVVILEAVSTACERQWFSTLGKLAQGHAEQWFDSQSPALIMIGHSLKKQSQAKIPKDTPELSLEGTSAKIHNSLQNSQVLTHRRRRA
jgi:uroporphyrin-III C-methyltransferase